MTERNDRPPFDHFDADAFVGDVLGRTSGSACGQAETRLEDLMADRLTGLDRQLVQSHLEHCAGCRDLAVTMGWLAPLLPQMAEVEPGPAFLTGVLARTSQARRPALVPNRPTGAAGLMDRLGSWWEKQILRPQFALQAAYAATVLLVLLTALPVSPLKDMPSQALRVMTAGPGGTPLVGPAVVRASDWVDGQGALVVNRGRASAGTAWSQWQDDWVQRATRTADSRRTLTGHWDRLVTEAEARNLGGAGYQLLAVLRTGQEVWQQWWQKNENRSGS